MTSSVFGQIALRLAHLWANRGRESARHVKNTKCRYFLLSTAFIALSLCVTALPAYADCSTDNPSTCTYVPKPAVKTGDPTNVVTITPQAFTPASRPYCQKVTNSCAGDIMVPTGTQAEWTSFITNHESCAMLSDCDTYSAVNITYGTCTAVCGGGTCAQSLNTWSCQQHDATTGITSIMSDNSACIAAGNTPTPTQTYTNNALCPINGACGSDNKATLASLSGTDSNLCTTGTASGFTGSGPWSWSCNGSNGGSPASCSAAITVAGCPAETVTELPAYTYNFPPDSPFAADNGPWGTLSRIYTTQGASSTAPGAVQGIGGWQIPATLTLPASGIWDFNSIYLANNPSFASMTASIASGPAWAINGTPRTGLIAIEFPWPGNANQAGLVWCGSPPDNPTGPPIWYINFLGVF